MWKYEAFQKIKDQLKSDAVLIHFDPSKPLVLACNASPYGVGAVLSHRLANNVEHPIVFVSHTQAPAEVEVCSVRKGRVSNNIWLKEVSPLSAW